jgi:hypothetical protein
VCGAGESRREGRGQPGFEAQIAFLIQVRAVHDERPVVAGTSDQRRERGVVGDRGGKRHGRRAIVGARAQSGEARLEVAGRRETQAGRPFGPRVDRGQHQQGEGPTFPGW